jgi:hypothetical protein
MKMVGSDRNNPPRQVKMNSHRRLLGNVPVLRFGAACTLAALIATF